MRYDAGYRIGEFELREIKANGDLIVGCHYLQYDEVARVVHELKLA